MIAKANELGFILTLLALTASAQTNAWSNPSQALMLASNAVAMQSTAPMLHLAWTWPADQTYLYGNDQTYPTNVNAVIQENDDLTTSNWTPVLIAQGTNGWVFATNRMGFFRATSSYVNQ